MSAHEPDEWRDAVAGMSEMERFLAEGEPQRSYGLVGDVEDVLYGD